MCEPHLKFGDDKVQKSLKLIMQKLSAQTSMKLLYNIDKLSHNGVNIETSSVILQ